MSGDNNKKRKREARKQAEEDEVFDYSHSGDYNIWYHKAEDHSTWKERRDAKLAGKRFKLNVEQDSGATKASAEAHICLHFARGKCVSGPGCKFRHEIPNEKDEDRLDQFHDVFGRDRHSAHKADMTGTGSFLKNTKTLYVGGIRIVPKVEEVIFEAFSQFGTITYLRIVRARSVAFVQYKLRVSAEFAKEAMSDQSIVSNEILNIRWATDNPNPQAAQAQEDRMRMEAWAAMKKKFPEYYGYCEDLLNEEYPDTDGQFVLPAPSSEQALEEGSAIGTSGGKMASDSMGEFYYFPEKLNTLKPKAEPKQVGWQEYYSSLGYPGYYDENGQYHYYSSQAQADAAVAGGAAASGTETTTEASTTPEATQQNYDPAYQQYYAAYAGGAYAGYTQQGASYDYYQQVSQAPVEGAHTTEDYYGYFSGYGTLDKESANAPLYPPGKDEEKK